MIRAKRTPYRGGNPMQLTNDTHLPRPWRLGGRAEPPIVLRRLVADAGIQFNGDAPWDIQVLDPRLYRIILTHGSLGFGEAYMEGLWECGNMAELFNRLLSIDADARMAGWARVRLLADVLRHGLINLQSSHRAFQVGER